MSQTVVGIFNNLKEAQKASDNLLDNGFARNQVDISEDYGSNYSTYNDTDRKSHDDGISGFFDSLFGSDDKVDNYKTNARNGSTVSVHTQSMDRAEKARNILDEYGAIDMEGDAGYRSTENTNTDGSKSIPVIEEEFQVGKRKVETGGVSVRSRIIERPVEESLRLRTEHVHVERNPVDRKATAAELDNFAEGEIEMTEHREEAVVNKEARVTEEINVSKDVDQRKETIREEVRETEVDVDETSAKRTDAKHDSNAKRTI
ncbi:YsnF/AvaK domain-containing protein [Tunicatimonas pelagia]|uniref:YsnF/AvaK domain-containing protein n=1 Tax=Tunicatimonas pelagia TaxID=931531 RepID=UPI002666D24C|nr:YsnF/AvaK domain-containing protein [Tunicatimonas pelagia]WKN42183.1 YsnF/AvaK domain-containing protein [Tunicatimonas pelagia]